jgi:hypothetical protein
MVITSYAASRRGLLLYLAAVGPVGGLVVGLIVLFAMGGTDPHRTALAVRPTQWRGASQRRAVHPLLKGFTPRGHR